MQVASEGSASPSLGNCCGNHSGSLVDQAPGGILIQSTQSRHIETEFAEDACIAIRSHCDQPDLHQFAREFPNGMHSQEFQILALENQLEKAFFLADNATSRIVRVSC